MSVPHSIANGQFTDVTNQVCPEFKTLGMITDLQWGDLNGDQEAELLVTGEWMPLTVFEVADGKMTNQTAAYKLDDTNGWWNCATLADLNNDGQLDILAGNLGLNTRLKSSKEEPLRILVKDFDRNGSLDPIITYFNDGKEYPLARLEGILKQIPGLRKKFVYFEKNVLRLLEKSAITMCF